MAHRKLDGLIEKNQVIVSSVVLNVQTSTEILFRSYRRMVRCVLREMNYYVDRGANIIGVFHSCKYLYSKTMFKSHVILRINYCKSLMLNNRKH